MCALNQMKSIYAKFSSRKPLKSRRRCLIQKFYQKMLDSVKMGFLIEIGILNKASLGSNSDDLFQLNPQEFV